MAKETVTLLTDDIDGGEAVEEVSFSLRGAHYEIDLNAKNVAALEKALDKYIQRGRRVRGSSARSAKTASGRSSAKTDLTAIREWARANGFEVSERGRISQQVRNAFEAANA